MNGLSISLALLSLAGLPQEKVVYVPGWHRCARGEDEALRFVAAAFPDGTGTATAPGGRRAGTPMPRRSGLPTSWPRFPTRSADGSRSSVIR